VKAPSFFGLHNSPLIRNHILQDTLIVWTEQDKDYALSFQEKAGCDEIWEKICQVSSNGFVC